MVSLGAPWVLTWEINDGAEQDLNDVTNHIFIKSLLATGAFGRRCGSSLQQFLYRCATPVSEFCFPCW